MQLRKVVLKNEEITIAWEDRPLQKSETTVSHELTSGDAPSPEFRDAMDAAVAPALRLLELPEDYGEDASFRSLLVAPKEDGRRGFTVSVTKPIAATNAPFNISTLHAAEASEDDETGDGRGVPEDLMEAIAEILKYAQRFAKGFERENRDLFEDAA